MEGGRAWRWLWGLEHFCACIALLACLPHPLTEPHRRRTCTAPFFAGTTIARSCWPLSAAMWSGSASAGTMLSSGASTSTDASSECRGVKQAQHRRGELWRQWPPTQSVRLAACVPCGCLQTSRPLPARSSISQAADCRTAPCTGPALRLYCRMEYVLHPDPNGPHPVDGWPGNPWIYQVGPFHLHCPGPALPSALPCSGKPALTCRCGCPAAAVTASGARLSLA